MMPGYFKFIIVIGSIIFFGYWGGKILAAFSAL